MGLEEHLLDEMSRAQRAFIFGNASSPGRLPRPAHAQGVANKLFSVGALLFRGFCRGR